MGSHHGNYQQHYPCYHPFEKENFWRSVYVCVTLNQLNLDELKKWPPHSLISSKCNWPHSTLTDNYLCVQTSDSTRVGTDWSRLGLSVKRSQSGLPNLNPTKEVDWSRLKQITSTPFVVWTLSIRVGKGWLYCYCNWLTALKQLLNLMYIFLNPLYAG